MPLGTTRVTSLLALATVVSACTAPNRVLFVTSSTIGMDADSKPATASIGYERIEGYVGPRYQDGSVPPVVASIATDGTVFSPKIVQLYATGPAAELAVGEKDAQGDPAQFKGDPDPKQLIFFGTTTTLGFRVGFDGSAPDSATLGYKRKEFAVLPLGAPTNTAQGDPLPSVLASINTAIKTGPLNATGLTAQQFFATGAAAESLAASDTIRREFTDLSSDAVSASLTAAQAMRAQQEADLQQTQLTTRLAAILKYVAPGGAVDSQKLDGLIDKADAGTGKSTPVPLALKKETTVNGIEAELSGDQAAVNHLYGALPPGSQNGENQ